jgi:hypothetical protein
MSKRVPGKIGLQAFIRRVDVLTGPELRTYLHETLGVESSDAEAAIRCRLHEDAQEIYIEWAKQQMRLACGLVIALEDPSDDTE